MKMYRGWQWPVVMIFALMVCFACCKTKKKAVENGVKAPDSLLAIDSTNVDSVLADTIDMAEAEHPLRIGVVWRRDMSSSTFVGVLMALREAGVEPVVIGPVKDPFLPYRGDRLSNLCLDNHGILRQSYANRVKRDSERDIGLADTLAGIAGMVFPGGEDMSPTLFRVPEPWHGIESELYYDSTRDVSDYLLMRWCLDHDIPSLCICRGMQVLCILSDVPMIQDIAQYYRLQGKRYNHVHRGLVNGKRRFSRHDVEITDTASLLYKIAGSKIVKNAPSWHHQAARPVLGDNLKLTAFTTTNGIRIVEGVERSDKKFFLGVQWHPEIAVRKSLEGASDADEFMSYDEGMKYFEALVEACRK